MDDQDQLQIVARNTIQRLRKPRYSLMPSFRDALSEQELQQLVAYLFSIRKVPEPKGAE